VVEDLAVAADAVVVVVCPRRPSGADAQLRVRLASRFRFATGGVADAIDQARATAGDKDVVAMGGANVIDQSLAARLVDELRIHLSPLVLGEDTRLFDLVGPTRLVQREVITSPRVTHLTYEVVRD
jgi:dihydrofolate reductase